MLLRKSLVDATFLLFFPSIFQVCSGDLTIALPINSQVPPVAQAGEAFEFVFSYNTFSSGDQTTQYSLRNNPPWLHLDGPKRRLFGTPAVRDVGASQLLLVATDESEPCAMNVTLVVSNTPGPILSDTLKSQLSSMGATQDQDTILFYPQSDVDLKFDPNTFSGVDSATNYYAVGTNNTPLPSWLHFDSQELAFRGETPFFTSPAELPQDFNISIIASDVPGFAQARASFRLRVESHELLFTQSEYMVDIERGKNVSFGELSDTLLMDGEPMPLNEISSASADQPPWLFLNSSDLTFYGLVPQVADSSNFTVTVSDASGDTATALVMLSMPNGGTNSSLIRGNFGRVNVTIGKFFNYTFARNDFAAGNISISWDFGNTSSWLRFDQNSFSLYGTAPSDWQEQRDKVNMTVSLDGYQQSQIITLNLVAYAVQATQSTISILSTSTATGGSATSSTNTYPTNTTSKDATKLPEARLLVPAILFPLLTILLVIALFLWIRKRRCRDKDLRRRNRDPFFGHPHTILGHSKFSTRVWSQAKSCAAIIREPKACVSSEGVKGTEEVVDQKRQAEIPSPVSLLHIHRPHSLVPQIGAVMEQRPSSLRAFWETYTFGEPTRRDTVMLPDPLPKTLEQARPQFSPRGASSRTPERTSKSSIPACAGGLGQPPLLKPADFAGEGETLLASASKGENHTMMNVLNRPLPVDPVQFGKGKTREVARRNSALSTGELRTSDPYQTTSTESWTTLDNIESSSHSPNRDTLSTVAQFMAQASPLRRQTQYSPGFGRSTIRHVPTSLSSGTGSHSEREPEDPFFTALKDHSKHSAVTGTSDQAMFQSPAKRVSWGPGSQYSQYLRQRRQHPATIRFSNSSAYRPLSSSHFYGNRRKSTGESRSGSPNGTDKENAGLETWQSPRKRSKASVQKLGRQMQRSTIFATRPDSLRSLATSSSASIRVIEQRLESTEEQARYVKRTGSQRRSSWHRLSALQENQAQTQAGQSPEIRRLERLGNTVEHRELPVSQSLTAELDEYLATDDDAVTSSKPLQGVAGLTNLDGDDDSKAFV